MSENICLTKEKNSEKYKGGIFLLSEKIKKWLADASWYSSSNLIALRGNKIIYLKNYEGMAEDNIENNISNELRVVINKLEKEENHEIYDLRNEMIPIFDNDKQNYKGQVILPVWVNNKLKYTLVFYRLNRPYIESSTKVMITTRKFIPIFIENDRKLVTAKR